MKHISVDIETLGIEPESASIIEFGAVIDDLAVQAPLDTLPRFHAYITPPDCGYYSGDPYAMSMHPTILRRIANRESGYNYYDPCVIGAAFLDFVKKFYFDDKDGIHNIFNLPLKVNVSGKNFAMFDFKFIKYHTNIFDFVYPNHRILDPCVLFINETDTILPSTAECYKRAGLESSVAHTSIDDALGVIQLLRNRLGHLFKKS